ncbi:ornithine carbamoyltransferase [Spizellomyces punctatus DAOM BR117]|uniref:ornithine carbamoyltransferase n=1 Tax=Spizellomyces punctatus (strain DAOM BR117) TaxID=645134 RepID=A0A0L0HJW5_SPIPD|nr:ornithine carbamoyltransferase [Spizellomyces punctatus DAOM BR117]KND01175.1 ornithine carbamoyltransferase [Spizellomyces punctatus DAOM BR117]|eukprot:XP_016609214.1 ornithine carbamoyltransferase [Spizellomyces punctatus DAOM BR117]
MPVYTRTIFGRVATPSVMPVIRHRCMSSAATANVAKDPSPAVSFKGVKNLLTLRDFSTPQILQLIRRSLELKQQLTAERKGANIELAQPLAGKTLGMIFTKRSTRTRVSAETGWAYFGGHPMFLGKEDIQIGGGEPLKDTAVVVSSMVDALLARVGAHEEIEIIAENSTVPVINALTAKYHPLQGLADVMTLYETSFKDPLTTVDRFGLPLPLLPPMKIAWVGDANNIINSLLVTLPRLGPVHLSVATPKGYNCDPDVVNFAIGEATGGDQNGTVEFVKDPRAAVKDSDIIITDTWVSMGQESEKAKRLQDFAGYQITEKMAKEGGAKPDWKFMHCLPRKQEEVDDEVFYNPKRSIVFQEAENRKYTVMAVYEMLMLWAKQ